MMTQIYNEVFKHEEAIISYGYRYIEKAGNTTLPFCLFLISNVCRNWKRLRERLQKKSQKKVLPCCFFAISLRQKSEIKALFLEDTFSRRAISLS